MYGCSLWSRFFNFDISRVKVAYNNVFRYLFNTKKLTSMSTIYLQHEIDHFNVVFRKAIFNLRSRVLKSDNGIIMYL